MRPEHNQSKDKSFKKANLKLKKRVVMKPFPQFKIKTESN